jgi:hypothetical protein
LKRLKISGPVINIKYIFLVISIFFICFGIFLIVIYLIKGSGGSFGEAYTENMFLQFFNALIFYLFYIGLKYRKIVEFDAQYLYVTINKKENKIDLKDIIKIEKPILQLGNTLNNWVIDYKQENEDKKTLKVNISSFRADNFDKFLNRVKNVNKKVIIKIY